ncbi:hypothetical protein L6452_13832 [Arctium lappa]|uniref:Uncharacterized protein n=1 Tax=Arctium lappa TaxID=4217 RepID=A0ACB9CJ99_ARCLA|nr:hypothetical protein L6452_13832 [Arctium lappa]
MVSSSSNPIKATPINQAPPENHPEPPPSPSKPTKRITISQSRFQTRPMTADEGSAIVISDDTGSRSVGSKPKNAHDGSSPMKRKREPNLLDTLAEAAELRARVKLTETLDEAMKATDEILGINKDTPAPSIRMIEVEPPLKPFGSTTPSFDLKRITKPRTRLGPSLRQNVTIALADLDQILGLNIPPQPKVPVNDPISTPNTDCDHSVVTPEPNNPEKSTVREENMQEGVDKETNIHDEGTIDSQPSETQDDTPPSQEKHKSPISYNFDKFGMIEENLSFDDYMTHDEETDEPQNQMPSPAQTTEFTNNVTKTISTKKRKEVDQNQKEADMGEQEENRDSVENQEGENEKNQADHSEGDPKQS